MASQGSLGRVFTGEYRHAVDDKGRIAIPAKFRAQLDGGAFIARWVDACLAIFPRHEFEALAAKVGGLGIADPSARTFGRALFASTYELELDKQGRMVLPASLRQLAGLDGDAVIVGAMDHAEIWSPTRWDDLRKAMDAPEAMAGYLNGLGI